MQPTFTLNQPLHVVILAALLVLLVVQMVLLIRSRTLSPARKVIRAGLNGLLWVLALAYVLQPTWPANRSAKHALLVGEDVPGAVVRRVKDSLRIRDSFTARLVKADYDSVTLLGQGFPTETLTGLSSTVLRWIPYDAPDQTYGLRWKAVVREGEMQRITGQIAATQKQTLRVRYGNRTVDSLTLREGDNAVAVAFPAVARGRTQTELTLNGTVLDTIRFFAQPLRPLRVQFILNSPDFESKTLADWLGRHGHTVQVTTALSKNVSSDVRINPGKANSFPDLLITDPANAGATSVRKAVTNGQAVLFINLTNPDTDCRAINRATGSRWVVRRISTEATVPLGNGLSALPYRFGGGPNQFPVADYPVAIQRAMTPGAGKQTAVGRVGVSLLGETFPLALSGDSLTYSRVWTAVLAQLYPNAENNIVADAPVESRLRQTLRLNNLTTRANSVLIGKDTVQLAPSSLNDRSVEGTYFPTQTGWQPIADSAAIYVHDHSANSSTTNREIVRRFMLAHSRQSPVTGQTGQFTRQPVPGWLWLALFLVVLSALWIEPKLGVA